MLPVRPIRAAILAFFAALALVEVGAGVVVGQAWRLDQAAGGLSAADRANLHQMLERLRTMEDVVIAGALAATFLWIVLAVHNTVHGARGSRSLALAAVIACVASPVLFLTLRSVTSAGEPGAAVVLVVAQAVALYLPFGALAAAAAGVGGPKMPFVRWYLALAASFVVHDVFTSGLDLSDPQPGDDLGRTAAMFLINAVVVAVMALMAAEATSAMDSATSERAASLRHLHDDAHQRVRSMPIADTVPPLPSPVPSPAAAALSAPAPGTALPPPLVSPDA